MKNLPVILMLAYAATLILGLVFRGLLDGPVDLSEFLSLRVIVPLVLVMPFLETIFIQFLLIEIVMKIGGGRQAALYVGAVVAAVVFVAMHLAMNGLFNSVVYGIPGALSLSTMYVVSRDGGSQRAFFNTWMLLLCSNLLLVLSMAFYGMAITGYGE